MIPALCESSNESASSHRREKNTMTTSQNERAPRKARKRVHDLVTHVQNVLSWLVVSVSFVPSSGSFSGTRMPNTLISPAPISFTSADDMGFAGDANSP